MEEEIDLRPYVEALFKQWYWILGVAVGIGIISYLISFFLISPKYEATALIAIIPQKQVTFYSLTIEEVSPILTSDEQSIPLQHAYPELATSDEFLQILFDNLDETISANIESIQNLRRILTAQVGNDANLIRLKAEYIDAEAAAYIVNTWADLYVPWVNETYGNQNKSQLEFFENQLTRSESELAGIEEALIAYQATNRQVIIKNDLESELQTQANLLAEQQAIINLAQDIQQLREQIAVQPFNESSQFAQQLTALNLQLKTYRADSITNLQLQLDPNTVLIGTSQSDQLMFLDKLLETLSNRQGRVIENLVELEPKILSLQGQMQVAETELDRLLREHESAEEAYQALTRQVESERLTSVNTSDGVSLASRAIAEQDPVGPNYVINVLLGAAFGGMIAILWIILQTWRKPNN